MHLSRRFAPKVASISLLISLCVLAVISSGLISTSYVFRQGWFKRTGRILRRDSSNELSEVNVTQIAGDSFDIVVTITVCTPVDSLPTTVVSSVTALPMSPQNLAGQLNGGLTNAAPNIVTYFGVSAPSNSLSTLSAAGVFPTATRNVCQYYPSTVYPTGCSGCVKTSTVTNTYLTTVSDCSATQYSFIAALTVTVTANTSANVVSQITNSSLIVVPARSTMASQGFPLFPTGNKSSSAIICLNGIRVQPQQDCLLLQTTFGLNYSSSRSSTLTLFGVVTSSAGSGTPQQTPSGNILGSTIPATSIISLGNATVLNHFSIATSSTTAISTFGGFPVSNNQSGSNSSFQSGPASSIQSDATSAIQSSTISSISSGIVSSIESAPSITSASALFITNVTGGSTNNLSSTSNATLFNLSNLLSAEITPAPSISSSISTATTLLPTAASSSRSLFSATKSGLLDATSNFSVVRNLLTNRNSVPSSAPVITTIPSSVPAVISIKSSISAIISIPSIVSSAINSVTDVTSSGSNVILPVQSLLSSVFGDITAAAGSVSPLSFSTPALVSSILNDVSPIVVSISIPAGPVRSLVQSIVSEATAIVGPVVASALISDVLSDVNSIYGLALPVAMSIHSLIPSVSSDITTTAVSATSSIQADSDGLVNNVNSKLVSAIASITSVQSLIQSSVSDFAMIAGVAVPAASSISIIAVGNPSNVHPIAISALPPDLSTLATVNGDENIVVRLLKPIISIMPTLNVAVPNVAISKIARGRNGVGLLRKGAARSTTSSIMGGLSSAATVTEVISIITVFVENPPKMTNS